MKVHHNIIALAIILLCAAFASCSENTNDVEEFADWQNKNTSSFDRIYSEAVKDTAGTDAGWKIYDKWSFTHETAVHNYDRVAVQVTTRGTGSGYPLYTDSVKLNIRGRLLPSTTYKEGYVFMQSYIGEYNPAVITPGKYAVSSSTSGVTDGLATALQHMHIGDRWTVYVPYQLGYGTTASTSPSVPAYSMLIYDVELVAYYRAGTEVPTAAAFSGEWIDE